MKRKSNKPKSRNPMISVLAAPIFKQKNHGVNGKIYNRKKVARERLSGDHRLWAAA